jgi:hypothetical protein
MSGFATDKFPSKLGGGVPGQQPKGGLLGGGGTGRNASSGMEGGGARGLDRLLLRTVAGYRKFPGAGANNVITPFRRFFNAGDTAGTVNSAPSPLLGKVTNQVTGNSMVSRLHASGGGTQVGGAFYSGNPKYVYDSSLYVRYKKLVAQNRNYNDSSFGGDSHNASASALRRVRRGGS